MALAGPVTADEIHERYGWSMRWIESILDEWRKRGRVVVGRFRPEVSGTEYLSRRTAEIARRRALAALRKQIEAVEIPSFAAFLVRWQHADPRDQLDGAGGTATVLRQLYGFAAACIWLGARLSQVAHSGLRCRFPLRVDGVGEPVWIGETNGDDAASSVALSRLRFIERGTGAVWLAPVDDELADRMSAERTTWSTTI